MLKDTHLGVVVSNYARYHATEYALRDFDQIVRGRSTTSRFEVVSTRLVHVDKWIFEFRKHGRIVE